MRKIVYPVIANEVCYPFYLFGVGIAEPEYHVIRKEGLASHQILFTLEGEGVIKIDGKTYMHKKGSVFYMRAGVPHEYYPAKGEWKTCWVTFRGENLSTVMERMGFPEYICKNNVSIDQFQRIFDMILISAQDPVNSAEKCSLLIYEYIMTARRMLILNADGDAKGIIDGAVAYINEKYYQDITLKELCNMCHISEQHFCRVFKAKIGMRPLEYLARRRMLEAKVLLQSTSKSIADIGAEVGYKDPTYFGMVFKKYEGISPSRYRKIKNIGDV